MNEEMKMKVTRMRMLKMYGMTRFNRIRCEYITGSLEVTNMTNKMGENKLKLFGYVERRNNHKLV